MLAGVPTARCSPPDVPWPFAPASMSPTQGAPRDCEDQSTCEEGFRRQGRHEGQASATEDGDQTRDEEGRQVTYGEATREAMEAVQNLRRIERERDEQTARLVKARGVIERYLNPTNAEPAPEQVAAE